MPVKFNKNLKKLKALTIVDRVKPKALRIINKFIKDEILQAIRSGRSPVSKGGQNPKNTSGKIRFEPYSDSYKKAMGKGKLSGKKQRPVNLELTGKLLRSIKSKVVKGEYVRVWFTDAKAKYHDKLGAGKSKVIRRMIPNPKKGEDFTAGIRKKFVNALINAVKLSKR